MEQEAISYLYLLVDAKHSAFKIGVSSNPLKRSRLIPEKIDIDRSLQFSCNKSQANRFERTIHFLFDDDRVEKPKGDGFTEWFSMDAFEKIKTFILTNKDKLKWISYGSLDSLKIESKPSSISRRGFKRHRENPTISNIYGSRKIRNDANNKTFILSVESTEISVPLGFDEVVEVDRTKFVKLYVDGVKALQELSSAGAKVFELVYRVVQDNPGADRFYLHLMDAEKHGLKISRPVFHRGLSELIGKEFVFESVMPNIYFLNVNYLFNGNRLAFIKEFRLKEKQKMEGHMKRLNSETDGGDGPIVPLTPSEPA